VSPRTLLPLLASLFIVQGAFAGTEQAESRLKSAVDQVLAIADKAKSTKSLASDLRPVLVKSVSFDAMTRRAVGPGWRQFTDAQKKKATDLFTTLIIRTYSEKFTPGEHPVIDFKKASETAPGRVEIPTSLLYKGSRYTVIYRLEEPEGWRITDIVAEGVSLIANYRTQFDAEFKKGGADAVINALNRAVAETK